METMNRARKRKREAEIAINEVWSSSKGITYPSSLVEARFKRKADLDRARNEGFEILECLHGEKNVELRVPDGLVGVLQNPSDPKRELEALVAERFEENGSASNVDEGRKSEEVENPKSSGVGQRESPPDDDCCAICFGDFNIPCKTDCGHWYCASCILTFWNYSNVLKRCKCPICTHLISKLSPEPSLTLRREEEIVEALKKVQRYNRLFVGGAQGLSMKVLQLPLLFKGVFGGLTDPGRFRRNYYMARIIACLLTIFYEICGFDFMPRGILGVRGLFESFATTLVVILFLVGVCRRCLLRRRVRLLANLPNG